METSCSCTAGPKRREEPNALLFVRPPARSGEAATLLWGLSGSERFDAAGETRELLGLAELGELELQPGPVVLDGRLLVQARVVEGGVQAWLLGLDLARGELDWKLLLGQGSDLAPDLGRSLGAGNRRAARAASQPLLALGPRVFAGTHLGVGALVSAASGRPLWSFKNQRREISEPGWDGRRPLVGLQEDGAASAILWAPYDSDHLYPLSSEPFRGPPGSNELSVLRAGPLAVGESEILLGGSVGEVVVAGRSGPERTVSVHASPEGTRTDALYLGPDEEFRGRGLVGRERVLVASDRGLYAFDRTRDLYLLDYAPLPSVPMESTRPVSSPVPGGDLYARGGSVLVLGRDTVWSFLAR